MKPDVLLIRDILREIERIAPPSLQESYDHTGLQVGDVNQPARGALLCLDVTEAVVDEAIAHGCNLIIAHHPLLFHPLRELTGADYVQRCVAKACRHDVVIYAAHTNLDNAAGGVNDHLSKLLGLRATRILRPLSDSLLKLVTFVPESHADAVRAALANAGAGHIGAYDACSFSAPGEGRFRASEGCRPYVGTVGELHVEPEVRIETALPRHLRSAVVRALLAAHPYEEVAYDLYPLSNAWSQAGSGVVGELVEPMNEQDFLCLLKDTLAVPCVRHTALRGRPIRRVALCGGSGAFLWRDAVAAGADAFVTGEAKYNDFFDVEDRLLLAVIGHYESEVPTVDLFHKIISDKHPTFALHNTKTNTNPIKYL